MATHHRVVRARAGLTGSLEQVQQAAQQIRWRRRATADNEIDWNDLRDRADARVAAFEDSAAGRAVAGR